MQRESCDLLNSNIIVTQNGKVISNDVPSDLSGKYVNPGSSNNDYFEITNENIIVSRSNCSNGGAVTIEKSQLRLYIDYLDTYREHDKYVTIKLEAIDIKGLSCFEIDTVDELEYYVKTGEKYE